MEDARDARFRRRQGRELRVWFGLVPVGDRVEVVGAVVGVAVLDGDLDRFLEGDGAFGVPAVEAIAAADALRIDDVGRAVVHVGEGLAVEVPCAVEVVLGAGAVDGGHGVAVDEDHVVAFAEPEVLVLLDGVGDADEVAAAGGFEKDVIALAVQILLAVDVVAVFVAPVVGPALAGSGLAVLRVEAARSPGRRRG